MEEFKARRCSDCSINYPTFITKCVVCDSNTWGLNNSSFDEDWEENAARLLGVQNPNSIYPHPEGAVAQRWSWNDLKWFKHEDLLKAGYRYLESGQVILVNTVFWELEGYSHEHEAWWVSHIPVEGVFDAITPEEVINSYTSKDTDES